LTPTLRERIDLQSFQVADLDQVDGELLELPPLRQ